MFESVEPLCSGKPCQRGAGGGHHAPVRAIAARGVNALSLPRFHEDIPALILPVQRQAANAAVARFLLEAGVLREDDIPSKWTDVLTVCEQAFNRWLRYELGELQQLNPTFVLNVCRDERTPNDEGGQTDESLHLVWYQNGIQQWSIGQMLDDLERDYGVGRFVLQTLIRQSNHVYPLFTPDSALQTASCLYWYGESNETDALDMEFGDDEEARAEALETWITYADFKADYPAWVLEGRKQRLALARLARLAETMTDTRLRSIVWDTFNLAQLKFKTSYAVDGDGEFVGFGGVLSWHEDDITVRVFDDLLEMAYQGESFDLMGELRLELSDPLGMKQWQSDMRVHLKAIRLIDRLIYHLIAI